MRKILLQIKKKEITNMEAVIFFHLYNNSMKTFTLSQLKFLFPYARTKMFYALKKLCEMQHIKKTDDYPARYYFENEK